MICEPACRSPGMFKRSDSCTVIILVSFCFREHRSTQMADILVEFYTFGQFLLLLFTELEHCPTHVLLSLLVQKGQNLEMSMPSQYHYFDELLLIILIQIEHFSTQLRLIFASVCSDMLETGIFRQYCSLSFFQNLELTRCSSRSSLVHLPMEALPLFILSGGTCHFCIQGYACHFLGSQTSLEGHFLSKICHMNFPFFGVKIFSNCKFLEFSSLIPQNKFLAVKFMTKIGQQKTSENCFQKLKNLEC